MAPPNLVAEVARANPAEIRVRELPWPELAAGSVRFEIERLALTANTVTYAAIGEMLGYWNFFPTDDAAWGRVPAIGWATVRESAHPEVPVGGRYFGWYPMARGIDVAVAVSRQGLVDHGPHRSEHAPTYREFVSHTSDPFYESGEAREDRHILLRGLLVTGLLIDEFYADRQHFGAEQMVVLSASSKTAIALAECAAARGGPTRVGVTSARNLEFVRGLGSYDQVLSYDQLDDLDGDRPAVLVDMAGNAEVREAVHQRFAERLRHSMTVGMSHFGAQAAAPPSVGPAPEMFFAPTQIQTLTERLGPAGWVAHVREATSRFIAGSERWLTVERHSGAEALEACWRDAVTGAVSPATGRVVSLPWPAA